MKTRWMKRKAAINRLTTAVKQCTAVMAGLNESMNEPRLRAMLRNVRAASGVDCDNTARRDVPQGRQVAEESANL
ncbi:hypothetical protein LCGC14_0436890 [marine sediment metagenome]|uniref:Uncharacterized protein n=1 Tax=marine sediment metagenome TaxID=412755 RepID=A0A0F9SLH7_9ZZZZ